jgi:hypothetical protein
MGFVAEQPAAEINTNRLSVIRQVVLNIRASLSISQSQVKSHRVVHCAGLNIPCSLSEHNPSLPQYCTFTWMRASSEHDVRSR